MYSGLTQEICELAWDIVQPSIAHAADLNVTNKHAGTVVVLDPWSGAILFQGRVNDNHPDREKYDTIALAKAEVSWETGLTSRQVQQDAPHLYRPGMTKWGGSAIENKLVVSFSGVQAVFDEAISWMVLNWILGLCQHEMTRPGGVMASEGSFIVSDAGLLDAIGAEAEQRMAR